MAQENLHVAAEKEKLLQDLERLREAGLLKRDEIATLSEANSLRESENARLQRHVAELKQRVAITSAACSPPTTTATRSRPSWPS